MRNLTDEEVVEYFDKDDLYYLMILMNNDTYSYNLPHPDRETCSRRRRDIKDEFQRLIKMVKKAK